MLGCPVDYRIVENFVLSDENVPQWNRDSADAQIQKAAILRNLNERYSLVTTQENLGFLMDALRACYHTEKAFIRDICRDARRRWKKWPKGVPTASPSRHFLLYASLLETWKITSEHVFSKSEIHGLGTSGG